MLDDKATTILLYLVLLLNLTQVSPAAPERTNSNTVIEIGDELQVLLKEDDEFQFRGSVDDSGNITMNYVGEVNVVNFTTNEFRAHLEKILLEQFYNEVTLSVSIAKQADSNIYVYGAVQQPGAIKLPNSGRISIQQALATVKGLTAWSNPKGSYVLRADEAGGQTKKSIDIEKVLGRLSQKNLTSTKEGVVYLYAGDELYIPGLNQDNESQLLTNAPREVIVVGQVRSPGIRLFAPGEEATLMRAIFKSGGMTQFAQGNKIKLIRYQEEERSVQIVNIDRVINKGYLKDDVSLNSGDMIIVPQKLINL